MPLFFKFRAGCAIALILLLPFAKLVSGDVIINEFMGSNGATLADEDGDFEDWIELYNPTAEGISLAGWGLSDNAGLPFKWAFPEGAFIEANSYLLVWASGKDRSGAAAESPVQLAPQEIDGLVLWLSADAIIHPGGSSIETWPDQSGMGNDATQPNASQRPIVVSGAVNGRPALRFSRSLSQQLYLPTDDFAGMDDFANFTAIFVARWTGGVRSGLLGGFRGSNLTNAGSTVFEISQSTGGLRLRIPTGIDFTAPTVVDLSRWQVLGAAMDAEAGTARIILDGEVVAQQTSSVGQTLLAQYERVPIASSHDDSRTFGGDIAEVILFNRSLNPVEQAGLAAYLSYKYALQPTQAETFLHTNFRISADGEPLVLTRPDGTTADFVPPVAVPRDISYGRRLDDPSQWGFIYAPTPGAANTTAVFEALIGPVTFSHAAGFYNEPVALEIASTEPGAIIVYTIDGSDPELDHVDGAPYLYKNVYPGGPLLPGSFRSHLYSGALAISDRSSSPNKLANIATTFTNTNHSPTSPINKATVVRARAFVNGTGGPIQTATYFVSDSGAFDYSLPVLSLSLSEDRFFDYFDGIYVAGIDHVESLGFPICNYGNFNRRGAPGERAGHAEFFHDGNRSVDQPIGIRIQGNCSRALPFKSLRLYARSVGEAGSTFEFPFFANAPPGATRPDNATFERLIARSPNFNDSVFSRLFEHVYEGVGGRIQPVVQFVNGEYWGIAMLRDRFDEYHLHYNYGLDPDNVTIINIRYRHEVYGGSISFGSRVFNLSTGIPSDMDDYFAMRDFVSNSNMADPELFAHAEALVCMDSFIDHLILKIFAGDDHYAPEFIFWRAREPENSGFGDGRWRVWVKDFDSTLRTANYVTGLATGSHPRSFGFEMFHSLLDNPGFRNRFINRFADLLNTHFRTDRFLTIIDEVYDEVIPYWPEMVARWNNTNLTNPNRPFTASVRNDLINWATDHPARQRGHIRQHFGIASDHALTVHVSDSQHGHVQVNSLSIHADTPGVNADPYPWSGTYFNGIPIRLVAHAAPGYRFSGWVVPGSAQAFPSAGASAHELELTLTADTQIEAVFVPVGTTELLDPPLVVEAIGDRVTTLDLTTWFLRTDGQPLQYSVVTDNPSVLAAAIEDSTLTLIGLQAGETAITVSAADGQQAPVTHSARVLIYGSPFSLADGTFRFSEWHADEPVGSFPAHMLFVQSAMNDPGLSADLLHAYSIAGDAHANDNPDFPYAATSRTRINGLGDDGISFINTGRGRDLGAAIVSLDTTGQSDIQVSWTAGTLLPNSRIYALRLQYRIGLSGGWHDVTAGEQPMEYLRNENSGHVQVMDPVLLPADAENQPLVFLRWKYYHVAGTSGPRAMLRLDDIVVGVSSSAHATELRFGPLPQTWLQSSVSPGEFLVRATDSEGLIDTDYNGIITLSILGEPALAGTTVVQAVNGVAVFDDWRVTGPEGAFLLRASASGLTDAESAQLFLTPWPVFLPLGTNAWNDDHHWSSQIHPNGGGAGALIPAAPATASRDVELHAPVTIGHLTLDIGANDLRNRVGDQLTGNTLTFDNGAADAVLRVLGSDASYGDSSGFAELNIAAGTIIQSHLRLQVDTLGGSVEYGALRLRETWSGTGNLIKEGVGIATFTGAGKNFTGNVIIERGVLAFTAPSVPSLSGSTSVAAGAQLRLISSSSSSDPIRSHTFGGVLTLAGSGWSDGPIAVGAGVLGALRYHPKSNNNLAEVTNAIQLAADASIHVDGVSNTLVLSGPVTGNHTLGQTGGGTVVLSGGGHVQAITSGSVLALQSNVLNAARAELETLQLVFDVTGSSGNGVLRLTSYPSPQDIPARLQLLVRNTFLAPGDRLRGGIFVPHGVDLNHFLQQSHVEILVPDPSGPVVFLNENYRPAEAADQLSWRIVNESVTFALVPESGNWIEVVKGGKPVRFEQWLGTELNDPAQRQDSSYTAPEADPFSSGTSQLMRYAMGLSAQDNPANKKPHLALLGDDLVYHFPFDPELLDLRYQVKVSSDLLDWTQTLYDSTIHTDLQPVNGWLTLPITHTPPLFLRMAVDLVD